MMRSLYGLAENMLAFRFARHLSPFQAGLSYVERRDADDPLLLAGRDRGWRYESRSPFRFSAKWEIRRRLDRYPPPPSTSPHKEEGGVGAAVNLNAAVLPLQGVINPVPAVGRLLKLAFFLTSWGRVSERSEPEWDAKLSSALIAIVLLLTSPAHAVERPAFDPQIGAQLDLDKVFRDASGGQQTLSAILGGRPALLVFGYDKCPNLCGVTQQAVASDLNKTGLDPETYRALFVSIDPSDTSEDAAATRDEVAPSAGEKGMSAWRFLTSADGAGAALAAEAGITFGRRDRINQYIHPIAVIALTPQGRLAQVLPALTFRPRDLRLALVEASAGRLGSIADHVFLLCSGFDTSRGQYSSIILAAVKVAGVATMLALGAAVLMLTRRRLM